MSLLRQLWRASKTDRVLKIYMAVMLLYIAAVVTVTLAVVVW